MIKRFLAAAVAALLLPACASAQVTVPYVKNPQGQRVAATPVITVDTTGAYVAGGGGGGGSGDASAANQTAVQADAGADAAKVTAVQGVTGGKAVPISASALPLPTGAATSANQTTGNSSLASIVTNTTGASTAANQATLNGYVDGLETLVGSTNTKLDALITSNAAILTAAQDTTTPVPVNISTGTIRLISAAASTNLTQIVDGACTVHTIQGYNAAATARYLKFYNAFDQNVTVGTTTPAKTIYLPPATPFAITINRSFSTGCSFALTTGSADADTGALTAADVLALNVDYK